MPLLIHVFSYFGMFLYHIASIYTILQSTTKFLYPPFPNFQKGNFQILKFPKGQLQISDFWTSQDSWLQTLVDNIDYF